MNLETNEINSDIVSAGYSVLSDGCASLPWFAVRTYVNRERVAADLLSFKGFDQYLPTYKLKKRWSDRVVETEQALFPGYVFCRFDPKVRMPVLTTPGVLSVVGFGGEPAEVDESEIQAVKLVLKSGFAVEPCAFLKEGQRVRVTAGCMEGLEGILIRKKSGWRVVVSVAMLQRSVAVEVDGESVCKI